MKKTYFASDFHLGAMGNTTSEERERKIVRWLRSIASDAEALYLVGDVFDFWFDIAHLLRLQLFNVFSKLVTEKKLL